MSEYIVRTKEIWAQEIKVEASSPEEAILLIKEGAGDYLDSTGESGFFYVMPYDEETWDVYDKTGKDVTP